MAHQIVLAPRARFDLIRLYDYLEERAGTRLAQSYIDRIDALFDKLADFPGIGASRPELGADVRSTGVWPYVILYHVGSGSLHILRVVHGRRNIASEILK
jgi:toxin ParE1/3/4